MEDLLIRYFGMEWSGMSGCRRCQGNKKQIRNYDAEIAYLNSQRNKTWVGWKKMVVSDKWLINLWIFYNPSCVSFIIILFVIFSFEKIPYNLISLLLFVSINIHHPSRDSELVAAPSDVRRTGASACAVMCFESCCGYSVMCEIYYRGKLLGSCVYKLPLKPSAGSSSWIFRLTHAKMDRWRAAWGEENEE